MVTHHAVISVTTLRSFSKSTIWYAILDDGTNRCNLENLVGPTGLTHSEQGSDATCTQYSSANCNKY